MVFPLDKSKKAGGAFTLADAPESQSSQGVVPETWLMQSARLDAPSGFARTAAASKPAVGATSSSKPTAEDILTALMHLERRADNAETTRHLSATKAHAALPFLRRMATPKPERQAAERISLTDLRRLIAADVSVELQELMRAGFVSRGPSKDGEATYALTLPGRAHAGRPKEARWEALRNAALAQPRAISGIAGPMTLRDGDVTIEVAPQRDGSFGFRFAGYYLNDRLERDGRLHIQDMRAGEDDWESEIALAMDAYKRRIVVVFTPGGGRPDQKHTFTW